MAIQDIDDLISQLRLHPEWRDALRREIFTEDLLFLPQIVRELAEAQRRTAEQLEILTTRMEELVKAQQDPVQWMEVLAESQKRTEGHLDLIEARLFERECIDKAVAYYDEILRKIRVLSGSEVAGLLDQAEDRISQKERKQVLEADLILHGRRLADTVETYLLSEISIGIGLEEVHQAAQRARIFSRATEVPVISAVGGKSIIPDAQDLARELGVSVFLDGGLQSE